MIEYRFQIVLDGAPPPQASTCFLDSDVSASVRSFELLHDTPRVSAIVVFCAGEQVLRRTRTGGKSVVVWAAGRPERAARPPARSQPRRASTRLSMSPS